MTYTPIAFLEEAVQTPSHETIEEMRDLLITTLAAENIDTEVDTAGNTIASRGTGHPHIVLNTHIDTVTPHVPFERDDTIIRGRGACDAKGPLAALLAGFLWSNPPGRLTLAITPDEETRSTGAAALEFDADAYIVGEPTGLDICTAAKGRFEATINLTGTNAHAAEPTAGANAISAAGHALAALDTFDDHAGPGTHDQLGPPTLTPTVIDGGAATNQVPADCSIVIDRRSVPPETATGFRQALETHLRNTIPDGIDVAVSLTDRETPFLTAFATPPDAQIVQDLQAAGAGATRPFTAATEASYFADEAPTVIFGPGVLADDRGPVAHAEREYVSIDAVRTAADILDAALSNGAT